MPNIISQHVLKLNNRYKVDEDGNIIWLDLSNTSVENLNLIEDITSLEYIDLSGTSVKNIEPLRNLVRLRYINLSFTSVKSIPTSFVKRFALDYFVDLDSFENNWNDGIYLKDCSLVDPPKQVVRLGIESIILWFKDKESQIDNVESIKFINEVRVIFLGWGNAGKTTLIKRLIGLPVSSIEDPTHGIKIYTWQKENLLNNFAQHVTVYLWDFGGQEIQHNIHQYFLTENCIYVIVLDNRNDEQVDYWINTVTSFAKASPIFIVSNKSDQNPDRVNEFLLQQKYGRNLIKHFRISALYSKNISDLEENLVKAVSNHEFANFKHGIHWTALRNEVQQHYNFGYISGKSFRIICNKLNIIDDAEQILILNLLKEIGIVNYISDNFYLGDLYILNPYWITTAIYTLLLSNINQAKKGQLSGNEVINALSSLNNNIKYSIEDIWKIIEIMKELKLCYSKDNKKFIFPVGFPASIKPVHNMRKYDIRFQIHYPEFLPASIFNTFMIEVFSDYKVDSFCQTSIEFTDIISFVKVYVQLIKSNSNRQINITIKGDNSRDMLKSLRLIFRNIHKNFQNLIIEEHIPLGTSDYTIDYQELLIYEAHKEYEFFHPKTAERYKIIKLLHTFEIFTQDQINFSYMKDLNKTKTGSVFANNSIINIGNENASENKILSNSLHSNSEVILDEIRSSLLDLEANSTKSLEWNVNFTKALMELQLFEDSNDSASKKVSISKIDRIFKLLKDVKDWTAITLLPAEVATKSEKVLQMWQDFKILLSSNS